MLIENVPPTGRWCKLVFPASPDPTPSDHNYTIDTGMMMHNHSDKSHSAQTGDNLLKITTKGVGRIICSRHENDMRRVRGAERCLIISTRIYRQLAADSDWQLKCYWELWNIDPRSMVVARYWSHINTPVIFWCIYQQTNLGRNVLPDTALGAIYYSFKCLQDVSHGSICPVSVQN